MTLKEYNEFKELVRRKIRRYPSLRHQVDDITQFILMKRCEPGYKGTQRLDYAIVDYFRAIHGRSGQKGTFYDNVPYGEAILPTLVCPKKTSHDVGFYTKPLKESDQRIFHLYFTLGYTLLEIGLLFNMTESNVALRIREGYLKLRKVLGISPSPRKA